jgi:hypothetical protein
MTSYGGFTDRRGVPDRSLGDSGGAVPADSNRPVAMVLNVLLDDPGKAAIYVAETTRDGVTAWLPRKQITIFGAQSGRTIRVTIPLWLARAKNLATDVGAGQGSLF